MKFSTCNEQILHLFGFVCPSILVCFLKFLKSNRSKRDTSVEFTACVTNLAIDGEIINVGESKKSHPEETSSPCVDAGTIADLIVQKSHLKVSNGIGASTEKKGALFSICGQQMSPPAMLAQS